MVKKSLLLSTLLATSTALGLTNSQRTQHVNEIFQNAGITMEDCQNNDGRIRFCGSWKYGDALFRQGWDLYSNWSSRVTNVATHKTPWKISDTGKSYSALFETKDRDSYLVTVLINNYDTYAVVTWLDSSTQSSTSSSTQPSTSNSSTSSSDSASQIKSECDPGAVKIASIKDRGWVYTEWTQPASFPNPSVKKRNGGSDQSISVKCNGFDLNYSNSTGEYSFLGSSLNDVIKYSGIARYKSTSSIDFFDNSNEDELRTFGITYDTNTKTFKVFGENHEVFNNLAVGYRVDGKDLMPIFFEGKIYNLDIPLNAKVVEFYAMPSQFTAWQYLKINLDSGKLTLKAKNPFPQK